jgi:cytochrome P450
MAEPRPRAYPFNSTRLNLDPLYGQLRRHEPVSRVRLPYGGDAWLVTRHADVKLVLADRRFSRAAAAAHRDVPRVGKVELSQAVPGNIVAMDPPEHTRLRKLVADAFTFRRVELLRPRAEQIAAALLTEMAGAQPPVDLAARLAFPMAVTVICELLGIPETDRHQFRSWADAIVTLTAASHDEFAAAAGQVVEYLAGQCAVRRTHPTQDLLTTLVQARDSSGMLTEQELVTLGVALLVAGYETTAAEITLMTYVFLTSPGKLDQVRNDFGLLPQAVEELLRYIPLSSNASVLPRIALEDVELGGAVIRAGDAVLVSRPSANRDENMFTDAGEIDFRRTQNPHLTFGHGPHYCLGAHLARMELQVCLGALLRHFPGLRLAVPADDLSWKCGLSIRGLTHLPVTW